MSKRGQERKRIAALDRIARAIEFNKMSGFAITTYGGGGGGSGGAGVYREPGVNAGFERGVGGGGGDRNLKRDLRGWKP